MKSTAALLLAMVTLYSCQSPAPSQTSEPPTSSTGYDAELAAALGADDYGMRPYVMAFLKKGPNRSADSLAAANLQRAHLDNITRLAEEGKLVVAGPFLDNMDIRGIYIFAVATVAEAEALTATDPAIKAGTLVMELHPWYGSAALMKLNEYYPRIAKKQI
jgi:uncharacterized protein YciI